MDIRDSTGDEIYYKLEPDIRAFFDNYPIEFVEDKRLRVAKVISSWVSYMGEVGSKKADIEYFDYTENRESKAKRAELAWELERKKVTEFVGTSHPSLGHESIFSRHENITEIQKMRERKAEKAKTRAKASSSSSRAPASPMTEASEAETLVAEGMDVEQESGSR